METAGRCRLKRQVEILAKVVVLLDRRNASSTVMAILEGCHSSPHREHLVKWRIPSINRQSRHTLHIYILLKADRYLQ